MKKQTIIFSVLSILLWINTFSLSAQTNLFSGEQNRIVVFARFNGDPELDIPRTEFETMFNGTDESLQTYFRAISNNQLNIHSYLYPAGTTNNPSFELKYCYYCYDATWKGNYPNCKGNDITALFDVNIGFIIKDLVEKLEDYEDLPSADQLDSDNDGFIDHFVIVFRGSPRGLTKEIYSPQNGVISPTFSNTNGDITLKGKIIKNYTINFEHNSMESHCRFLLSYLGFPNQFRNTTTLPRTVGAWDPMDGPSLSYPLVYNRMKYSNKHWITEIPAIIEPGIYNLSSADRQGNNAYKIGSSDGKQFWVLEYRDNTATWEGALPESGLIIYRVNTNYTGSLTVNPEVYLYRKDGTPSVAGNILDAPFSNLNGQSIFNDHSNPYTFLSDGSLSNDIDISDITFTGDKMSFRVNKADGILGIKNLENNEWNVFVNSSENQLQIQGEGIEQVSLFDITGRLVGHFVGNGNNIPIQWKAGVYVVQLQGKSATKSIKIGLK